MRFARFLVKVWFLRWRLNRVRKRLLKSAGVPVQHAADFVRSGRRLAPALGMIRP